MYIKRLQENNIIKFIQSFATNNIINFMNLISGIIYNKVFFLIIIIFYILKLFTTKQFLLLILVHPFVSILKYLIKRNRPYINDSDIKLFDNNIIDKYSFPSGHSTFCFLIYFILHDNNIINKYYIVFPLLVGISRIMLGAHYITDVIGGIILAKLLSLLVK
jgi:undecaprenyl-diphosphatase